MHPSVTRGSASSDGAVGCVVLVPVPDELTSKAAAAVLLQGMTAHVMTHDVHHGSPGESALVHAAAGGTGSLLVQFLIQQGVTVLASTSSEEKAEYLRGIGVEHVIDHRRSELVAFGQSSGPVPPMDIARLSGLTDEGLLGRSG